jgi:hypothetical protein
MMELNRRQWLWHTLTHPLEGFEDMRWKKAGSVTYAAVIVLLWFVGAVIHGRMYGFQFSTQPDKLFNIIPYFGWTVLLFLTWVTGNWAVCTLLDGEGTMKRIFIFSAYALVPYVVSLYLETALSHLLIQDESVFLDTVRLTGFLWSAVMMFSAIKSVHQYSVRKTLGAVLLTIAAMLLMLFLLVLIMALVQQVYVFVCSVYTEIVYRIKV